MYKYLVFMIVVSIYSNIVFANPNLNPNLPSGSISGNVVDENNNSLPGTTVVLEHKSIGNYCNAKGNFFIKYAPVGEYVLIASMIGYQTIRQPISVSENDTVNINFTLKQGSFNTGVVVVTGTATPHLIEDSPVHTEVICAKTIEQKNAINLAEAIDGHTGIIVENNCSNCNFAQVRINGLDGKYSEVLINGDPVFSTLAGVYGLEQIPEAMISSVEIVKGGGSSLYGGGAVAGVINVITKKPLANRMCIKHITNGIIGTDDNSLTNSIGMEHKISATAEFVSNDGNAGGFLFGSTRTRQPFDYNGDGFTELGSVKSESYGFNTYFDISNNQLLEIDFHHIHEDRRGGNDFKKPLHEAEIAEAAETWRWGGKIGFDHTLNEKMQYKTYYSFGLTDRDSYYGGTAGDNSNEGMLAALDAYGKTHNPLHMLGFRSNINLGKQLITWGGEYKSEGLVDFSVRNEEFKIDKTYTNYGIYIQDNLHFFEDAALEIVFGIRADKHSELDNFVFSPRITAKYSIVHGINLRASFGTGFKPPQVFDEDLHIESMSGKQRTIRNKEGLKPERSQTFSLGMDYLGFLFDFPFFFNSTVFYNHLTDAFDNQFDYETENMIVYKRINSGTLNVSGIDINCGVSPNSDIEISFGINYKNGIYNNPNPDYGEQRGSDRLKRTPDLSANLVLEYNISHNLSINSMLKYLGEAYLPHESLKDEVTGTIPLTFTDDYYVLDFNLVYEISFQDWNMIKLGLGVKNLLDSYQNDLDVGINRDPLYVYGPPQPRTLYIGIDLDI